MVTSVRGWSAVVAVVAAMLVLAPSARAGDPKNPNAVLAACLGEMVTTANVAADELEAISTNAEADFEEMFNDLATASKLYRAASGFAAQVDKVSSKAVAKLNKAANKCRARLERLNADQALLDELEDELDEATTFVYLNRFTAIESIHTSLETYLFPE